MFENAEVRKNRNGSISYWKDDVLIGQRCTKCGEDKEIHEFYFKNKKEGIRKTCCKECESSGVKNWRNNNLETARKRGRDYARKWGENNPERIKEIRRNSSKKWRKNNPETAKERIRRWRENNSEREKESIKKWRIINAEKIKEQRRKWKENNPQYHKIYFKTHYNENKEHYQELGKKNREKRKEANITEITNMLHKVNPLIKKTNINAYGIIYKITHINGKCYIGQTIHPLKVRYRKEIIKKWIEEKTERKELKEEDLTIEVIDYGICKYHLDKLEVFYINKYDSYKNGYNNNAGHYNTNDGLEEFEQILKENNLKFIDNELVEE